MIISRVYYAAWFGLQIVCEYGNIIMDRAQDIEKQQKKRQTKQSEVSVSQYINSLWASKKSASNKYLDTLVGFYCSITEILLLLLLTSFIIN